ncbi:MAG: hypothetical protein PF961_03460 [Planctomycetota bacterium]|jgi:3-deoxy-D-manno-octulosonic-acid transferase|nr:hypothetical protein [Planctomycetota bacterium]
MNGPATDLTWRHRSKLFAILLIPAVPLILLYLAHRLWVRRKGLVGLGDKLTGAVAPTPPGGILVHGVSLGEVQLMRPLVPLLEQRLGRPCVLTASSETGAAALAEHFPDHERRFLPVDLPWAVARFLQRTRPAALILLELEIWPLLLLACHARQIPVILVNARVSENSFAGYRRAGGLLRPILRRMHLALAQNSLWGARLRALALPSVKVSGSLKADMVRRASPEQRDAEASRLGLPLGPAHDKKVFLVASTSAGEEDALVATWRKWGRIAGWRLVICPRHPERGEAIADLCLRQSVLCSRTSCEPVPIPDDHAIIVDEIGRLGALYANATLCVVGGSLGSGRGGQNMLEAAAAGCATVVGTDTRNFPDAMALLRSADAVVEVDSTTLDATLDTLVRDPARRRIMGEHGEAAWHAGQGALARTIKQLAP